jgi:hypothetical protein
MSITTAKATSASDLEIVSVPTHICELGLNDEGGIDKLETLNANATVEGAPMDATATTEGAATDAAAAQASAAASTSLSVCGLVGQVQARQAFGVIVDLVAASAVGGSPRYGQDALATAISKELGPAVPFCPVAASTVYSKEVQKTEILMEHFRRVIGFSQRLLVLSCERLSRQYSLM